MLKKLQESPNILKDRTFVIEKGVFFIRRILYETSGMNEMLKKEKE